MSSVFKPSEPKRPASVRETVVTIEEERRRTFSTPKEPGGKHRDAGKQPIQEIEMIPASQMSRRPETSGAIHQRPQPQPLPQPRPQSRPLPPLPGQVIFTQPGRVQKQKIPPAVPVRKRKATTTVADTTQNSFANTSAQNSTVNIPAQNSMANIPAQTSTTEQKPQDIQIKNPFIPDPTSAKKSAQKNGKNKSLPQSTITLKTLNETTTKTTTPPKAPTEEKIPPKAPTKENTPPKTPAEENIPPKAPTKKNTPPKTPTEENIPPKAPTKENTPPKTPTEENIPPKVPTKKNTPPKTPTEENIPPKAPTKKNTPPKTPTEENIPPKVPTKKTTPPKTPTEENIPPKASIEENIPPKTPTEENIPPKAPTKENTPPKTPIEENIPPKVPTKKNTPPKTPTEENIPPKVPTKKTTPPKTPTEENTPPKTPTEENIPPKAPTKKNTPPKTPTEENIPPKASIEENIPPKASTEEKTPPKEKPDEQQKALKQVSPTNPTPPELDEKPDNDGKPQVIPPPPTRPRRASACNLNNESLLDPKDSLLIQRRSSSPFQTYTGPVDNEFLKSYFTDRKNASADTPQASQSQPNSLNASQKSLNSNASQKSVNPNASQKTLNKTSTDSLANINEIEEHTPIMVESIIIYPPSTSKPKRQSSQDDENSQKKISQFKANNDDDDLASELTAVAKVSKIRRKPLHHSATDLIELAPKTDKKKKHKGRAGHSRRRDSSSDSTSQTSSASYRKKTMEIPLLPNDVRKKLAKGAPKGITKPSSLTKSLSTPAGLQACVKFSGSNMTVHHKIIRDIRAPTNFLQRFKFRNFQFIINILVLVGLGVGIFMYFQPPEPEIKYINKTITNTVALIPPDNNPAPGYCFKIVVNFCINHKVPYNYTTFPNHVVNMNQDQAEQELDLYDAIVDVRCYELAALFLCSVFVPKCGPQGELLYPCRSLCEETKRRCGFFMDVFGLPPLPDYLMDCRLLPDSEDPDVCVGHKEVKEAKIRAARPKCAHGFKCDYTRCIPKDWKCDGYMDCEDKTDEKDCTICAHGGVHCGGDRCMNKNVICDGIIDCPYGQDERNCIRLHDKMGDVGRGLLQVYDPKLEDWIPACVSHWDNVNSASAICALLGYNNSNYTRLIIKDTNVEVQAPKTVNISDYQQRSNWVKDFRNCGLHHYPIVNMECQNFECGRKRNPIAFHTKRIVGGSQSTPGSWPFLAAIHGGPEEIFYCAGVLIADQWVLTASHCVGNASEDNLDGWKIQLGVTRRHSHSYYGQKVNVKRVISHPNYNMGINHDNDVALFQLERPVTYTEHVLPVCLPPPEMELRPGMRCTVIGWGKSEDDETSEYEPSLHEVEVPIISRRLCNEWMIYRELNVTEGMICAGLAEGGKDACQGDSGGPMLCPYDRQKKRWFVGGIVSWGIKCAHPQLPGVYAYVPKFVPWIEEMMNLYSDE